MLINFWRRCNVPNLFYFLLWANNEVVGQQRCRSPIDWLVFFFWPNSHSCSRGVTNISLYGIKVFYILIQTPYFISYLSITWYMKVLLTIKYYGYYPEWSLKTNLPIIETVLAAWIILVSTGCPMQSSDWWLKIFKLKIWLSSTLFGAKN